MQTTCDPASATYVARSSPPPASRTFHARHPSGVWVPCATCGLEQPEAPDCAACGAPLVPSPVDEPAEAPAPIQVEWFAADLVLPRPQEAPRSGPQQTTQYHRAPRIELDVAADHRSRELSHTPSPVLSLGLLLFAGFLVFHAASWFIEFTRGEVRAMAQVVDRLALPPTACESCEKPFRIVELRARPYYDPPAEQLQLFDPELAAPSQRWVEEMRREVRKAKEWAEEQRRLQEEETERLGD